MSDLHRHASTATPFISLVPIIIAGASMKARRQVVDRLRKAGATSPDRAIAIEPRSPMERRWIARMIAGGVVREVGPLIYLDEAAEQLACAKRIARRPLLIVAVLALALLIVGLTLIFVHQR